MTPKIGDTITTTWHGKKITARVVKIVPTADGYVYHILPEPTPM